MIGRRLPVWGRWSVALFLVGVVAGFAGRGVADASTTRHLSLAYSYDVSTPLRAMTGSDATDSSPGSTQTQPTGEWRASDQPTSISASDHPRFATEEGSALATVGETCNSFEHDTDVLMADGTRKPIDKVKIGDTVTATDPKTGKTGAHEVTALIRHKTDHTIVDVKIRGQRGDETIAATDHHPFYVTDDGGRWVDAGDLRSGDHLRSPDGTTRAIDTVTTRIEFETVYNLTIDGVHTYYVGDSDPVLAHNSGCDEFAQAFQRAHGGETHTFQGSPRTGPYALSEESSQWSSHTVVVKGGRVFDQFTGPGGIPIDEWKSLWDYPDAIDFGF